VFGAAQPAANACACDACSVTAPPTCVQGQLTGSGDFDGSRTCSGFPITLGNSSPGGCNTDNTHARIPNLDLQLLGPGPPEEPAPRRHGTRRPRLFSPAGPDLLTDATRASAAPMGALVPRPSPRRSCRLPAVASGKRCLPAGPLWGFVPRRERRHAELRRTCTCALNATCTSKTVTYYTDSMCQSLTTLAITANGTCQSGGGGIGGGTIYGSYKYTAAANATCSFAGSPKHQCRRPGERADGLLRTMIDSRYPPASRRIPPRASPRSRGGSARAGRVLEDLVGLLEHEDDRAHLVGQIHHLGREDPGGSTPGEAPERRGGSR